MVFTFIKNELWDLFIDPVIFQFQIIKCSSGAHLCLTEPRVWFFPSWVRDAVSSASLTAVRTERCSTCRCSGDVCRHVFWADAEEGLLSYTVSDAGR